METQVRQLQQLAMEADKRPVWYKLGENEPKPPSEADDTYSQFYKPDDKDNKSVLWITTNSEYGRFQRMAMDMQNEPPRRESYLPNEEDLAKSLELLGIRPASKRDPGASARSRAADVEQQENERIKSGSNRGLPGYDPKYFPIQPNMGGGDNDASQEEERKKLTTGAAKIYMTDQHGRFWENVKTVAPGAGFTVNQSSSSNPGEAEVLRVDHQWQDTEQQQEEARSSEEIMKEVEEYIKRSRADE